MSNGIGIVYGYGLPALLIVMRCDEFVSPVTVLASPWFACKIATLLDSQGGFPKFYLSVINFTLL